MAKAPNEIAHLLTSAVYPDALPRLLLVGPCGIGKSTVTMYLTRIYPEAMHIENDKLKESVKACTLGYFDFNKCFSSILSSCHSGFIIDLGGGDVFTEQADKEERLIQTNRFKAKHQLTVIMLIASYESLKQQFLLSRGMHHESDYERVWEIWKRIQEPYWLRCTDWIIDIETGNLKKNVSD